jgi:hypothetical protein
MLLPASILATSQPYGPRSDLRPFVPEEMFARFMACCIECNAPSYVTPSPPLSADRLGTALVMHDRGCHTGGWVLHGREFRIAGRHIHWYPNCCGAACLAISQQGLFPCSMLRHVLREAPAPLNKRKQRLSFGHFIVVSTPRVTIRFRRGAIILKIMHLEGPDNLYNTWSTPIRAQFEQTQVSYVMIWRDLSRISITCSILTEQFRENAVSFDHLVWHGAAGRFESRLDIRLRVEDCEVEIVRDDRYHPTHLPTLTCISSCVSQCLRVCLCAFISPCLLGTTF